MWSRPESVSQSVRLEDDIDKDRSASQQFSSSGSCQSNPGYLAMDFSQVLVLTRITTSCLVVVLFSGGFDSLLPPRLNLLMCYLSVSVCLKYAFLFSQIHYHRINFPLNIKYENISNIAEKCWSWRLNVFTLLSNSRWPRLCEWLCGVYEVPE